MLANSRQVRLANGHTLRTPLLVPSISSAGFKRVDLEGGGTEPESSAWLRIVSPYLTDALLISAYDAAHGNLPFPEDLAQNFPSGMYAKPKSLFIDSGLYEHAYGPPPFCGRRLSWSEPEYRSMLADLHASSSTILVNYDGYDDDGRAEITAQIAHGQAFFETFSGFGFDLLIKPERRGRGLSVDELSQRTLASLRAFDIVGIAEKDLGDSVLDKLCALAQIRRRLNEADVAAPIHLFGSLDPVMSPLYFAAGAEIFDGLSWLRYGYHWETALYRDDVPVLEAQQNLGVPDRVRAASMLFGNLKALGVLAESMRQFASMGDWDLFGTRVGDRLAAAHVALTTRMGE